VNIQINHDQIQSPQLFTVAETLTRDILVSRSGYELLHATFYKNGDGMNNAADIATAAGQIG
jgi:hypothetical protein